MKAHQALEHLQALAALEKKSLPVKISFAVSVNIEKLNETAKQVEKQRIAILEKFSKKDEDGKPLIEENRYQIEEGSMEEVTGQVTELMEEDVDVASRKVSVDALQQCDENDKYDTLTPGELLSISFMIEG